MRKRIFILFLLSFLIHYFVYTNNSIQAQQKKIDQSLQHEVTVILKLIQVFVTDKDGDPVTDLKISDFELYEDGELRTITDFEKHIIGKTEEKELPPLQKFPSRMNRKFFIFLDIMGNDRFGMIKSKRAALHFIDTQLEPGDEVGILSYAPLTGLKVQEYLTSDHQKIKKAVNKAKEVPPDKGWISNELEKEWKQIEMKHGLDDESGSPFQGSSAIPVLGLQIFARNQRDFFVNTTELAKALRYIPGYKNVIFFSGGRLGASQYNMMGREFSASNSPVFAVNSMKSRASSYRKKEEGEDPLKVLSDVSGGKYFEDIDNFEAISESIQNTTSHFYVLGYYIDEKWDGKYHEIDVKVKRKGCRVYAQGGYFNPKPFTELSELEKKLHLIDLALSENPHFQEPLSFSSLSLYCLLQEKSNLILLFETRAEDLSKVLEGNTEVVGLVLDEEIDIVDSWKSEINFSEIPEKTLYHYTITPLQPGKYECRVIIRNLTTGKGARASSFVHIPEKQESGITLYPPLVLIPDKKANYFKFSEAKEEKSDSRFPSLDEIFPFVTNQHSPLIHELDKNVSKLHAVLRCSIIGIQEPVVDISANLIENTSGEKESLSFSILSTEKKEETDILLLELELPELKPGEYSIEIIAEEEKTDSRSRMAQTFKVR